MSASPAAAQLTKRPGLRRFGLGTSREQTWVIALVALLAAEIVYFSLTVSGFFGGGTGLLALTEQFLSTGAIALGEAIVIFAGEIDLSAGAMSSLAGIVMAELWQQGGLDIWLAMAVALVIAALGGAVNGLITTRFGINSLLVTLATQFIFSSIATALGGGSPPYGFPKSFVTITGTGTIGPVPDQLVIFAVIALLVGLLIARTRYGRSLVLIGYNRSAARYSGVSASRTLVGAFTMSGLLAGVAGIFISGFYNAARDDVGDLLLLPAITMVVLGGVDIYGGKGRISGAIIAIFVLGFLTEGLLVKGDSSLTATMVTGIVLILGLLLKIGLDRRAGTSFKEALRRRASLARSGTGTN